MRVFWRDGTEQKRLYKKRLQGQADDDDTDYSGVSTAVADIDVELGSVLQQPDREADSHACAY